MNVTKGPVLQRLPLACSVNTQAIAATPESAKQPPVRLTLHGRQICSISILFTQSDEQFQTGMFMIRLHTFSLYFTLYWEPVRTYDTIFCYDWYGAVVSVTD